jgi:hypothetical protein
MLVQANISSDSTGKTMNSAIKSGIGQFALIIFALFFATQLSACSEDTSNNLDAPFRLFQTGFESINDFSGFYIVPQNHLNSASHDQSTERVKNGSYSHKGWIYAANPPSTLLINNNHRGYPTIQLYKTPGGGFKTPALVEFWV